MNEAWYARELKEPNETKWNGQGMRAEDHGQRLCASLKPGQAWEFMSVMNLAKDFRSCLKKLHFMDSSCFPTYT